MKTRYQAYRGSETVTALVREFYDRATASDTVGPFLQGCDIDRLVREQVELVCDALEASERRDPARLAAPHRHLQLSAPAFAEAAAILQDVLEDAGIDMDDVIAAMMVVGSVRKALMREHAEDDPRTDRGPGTVADHRSAAALAGSGHGF